MPNVRIKTDAAVVYVLRKTSRGHEVLLLKRSKNDSLDKLWLSVAGKIEEGETASQTGLRELGEETGVTADLVEFIAKTDDWVTYDLPADLVGKVWGGKFKGQRQKWFLYRYLGRDDQIDIATAHPEFAHWKWISADEMLTAIVPFKRAVYDQVIRAFRAHLA